MNVKWKTREEAANRGDALPNGGIEGVTIMCDRDSVNKPEKKVRDDCRGVNAACRQRKS
jgi:hypothetical protein